MELKQIAKDVYTCLQEDRGLGTSNSGLINRGGGMVIDTFWDLPHTRELIDTYARVWPAPARRVVNTHHNGDHCWGNQLFAGAEIIGHRLCAAAFGKEKPESIQMLTKAAGSADPMMAWMGRAFAGWDFSGIHLTPPTTLIDDRLEIDLDGLHAELLYVGPAHTQGDVIVHLPEQRVVFAGDVLFRLCTPIGWEGTFGKWTEALDRIIRLSPEVIVPGHGPLCGVEGPCDMKDYLEYVRAESRAGYDAGRSALETAKRIDLGPYASWTQPERLIFNVERAYREFRGEPWDAPIDVMRLFTEMHELSRDQSTHPGSESLRDRARPSRL
jgi:glyoxylase-like metal-dependent hydrolase (beta-lactamase superfamily II)